MPITDAELDQAGNAHILRPATETVFTALRAWRDTPNRAEWWWLIIQYDDQQYTAIRFSELRDSLALGKRGGAHMNTPLADLLYRRANPDDPEHPLPGVVSPLVVDDAAISTARAQEMAETSPGQVLIVLRGGKFRGILSITSRTFAFADKPLLDLLEDFEMGGESETIIVPRSTLSAEDTTPG